MTTIIKSKSNKSYDLGVPSGICTNPSAGRSCLSDSYGVELRNGVLQSLKRADIYDCDLPSDFVAEHIIIRPDMVLCDGFTGIGRSEGVCGFYVENEMVYELDDTVHDVAYMGDSIYIFPEKIMYNGKDILCLEEIAVGEMTFEGSTVSLPEFDFSEYFNAGDSVVITGTNETFREDDEGTEPHPGNIVSALVVSAEYGLLTLALTNINGREKEFVSVTEEATIGLNIPDMRYVTVHKNRIFGTDRKNPGRYIYASVPGRASFGRFENLASDSYFGEVVTPGTFSGCIGFGTQGVFFKKNAIHLLYGSSPTSFTLPYRIEGGCIKNNTVAEAAGRLYFLSSEGIMELSGSSIRCVSEGIPELSGAVCGAGWNNRYYAATDMGLYCYYPPLGVWLLEDSKKYDALSVSGSHFLGISGRDVTLFGKREEDYSDYMLKSGKILLPPAPERGVIELSFTLDKGEGETRFYADSGAGYEECGRTVREGVFHIAVPVRLRYSDWFSYKIEGSGRLALLGAEVKL